eukprot:gene173-240_t
MKQFAGETVQGQPNGWGRVDHDNNTAEILSSFEGNFVDGYFQGTGKAVYHNGDQYNGHWTCCRKSGQGIMTYATGNVYSGSWVDDKPQGE